VIAASLARMALLRQSIRLIPGIISIVNPLSQSRIDATLICRVGFERTLQLHR
jgi:hypothetical protein